jgi:hypothetical protein
VSLLFIYGIFRTREGLVIMDDKEWKKEYLCKHGKFGFCCKCAYGIGGSWESREGTTIDCYNYITNKSREGYKFLRSNGAIH